MALVNCRECGKQISDQAAACPHCGFPMRAGASPTPSGGSPTQPQPPAIPIPATAPQPTAPPPVRKSGCGTLILLGLVGVLVLAVLIYGRGTSTPTSSMSSGNAASGQAAKSSGQGSTHTGAEQLAKPSATELLAKAREDTRPTSDRLVQVRQLLNSYPASPEARDADTLRKTLEAQLDAELNPVGLQWSYQSYEDDMSGKMVRTARVSSTNSFSFDFPYSGKQHAELLLRRHPRWGNDVVLSIEKGQILCHSFSSCPIRVRFDDEAAKTYTGNEPADNSSETVFIPGYKGFTSKLEKAKRVRIEFNVYQQGSVMAEFDVSGFNSKRLNP